MAGHSPLYEIAQKIWEAAVKWEYETEWRNYSDVRQAAYPIITSLVQELRKRSCLIHGQRFAEKHGLELPPLPFDGEDGG